MKATILSLGPAIIPVAIVGLISTVNGRIQLHGHQHGDVRGRILHKPTSSSGSSMLVTATDKSIPILLHPTQYSNAGGCFGAECGPVNATTRSIFPSRVTAVPQVEAKDLELRDVQLSSRRHQRLRVRASSEDGDSAAGIELDSLSTSLPSTKPTDSDSSPASSLQRDAVHVDKALKNPLVQGAEDHGFPAFGIPDFHLPNHLAPRQDGGFSSPEPASALSPAMASVTAYGFNQPPSVAAPSSVSTSTSAAANLAPRQDGGYQSFVLGGFSSPFSTSALSPAMASVTAYGGILPTTSFNQPPSVAAPSSVSTSTSAAASSISKSAASSYTSTVPTSTTFSVCATGNGTTYTSVDGINYQVICNTDYEENNFPFQLVHSFAGCLQKCDAWNYDHHDVECIAAIYVPNRDANADADDCYLKSRLVNASVASGYQGAIRMGFASITSSAAAASSSAAAFSPTSVSLSSTYSSTSSSLPPTTSSSSVSSPGVTYASGASVIVPKVYSSHLQGPSKNTPTQQYLDIKAPAGITLASSLLTVGDNGDLTTGYDISGQTGVLDVNILTQSYLSPLKNSPHLSRDGGRGGMVNGEHLFIFCDTGSYSTTTSTSNGDFLGFVSSSVATDIGMNGLTGGPLNLQDGIGEWSDDSGRMRGFAPLTEGEMAYNQAMQGQGQRYAVWPEADIIPLNATTGIMYAPIVYDNVNQLTRAAVFTYTGATLLTITAGGKGGPVAVRTVEKIFQKDEIEWGCAGGIRSWGPSGIGGDDGSVYLFGIGSHGILLARTSPANVADRNSFTYWNGGSWTGDMLTNSSTAYFIQGSFMDVAVFYSPRHLTFIILYLTGYADSTFFFRYLEADQGILPPFAPRGDTSSDYVENILKYKWSEEQVLYEAAHGLSGTYIYSGGPHLGYFGSEDIINGGTKMLLSWTAPTGLNPATLTSEYQIPTAEIDWA